MRLITSFYTPDKGRVMIEGLDNQQHDVETRRFIGYLPENNPVYGDLLVYEYLQFVANLRGLKGAAKRESIAASVEETGVQEVYNRPINQCSKGYRQRTGLAQALLHRPDILIMDEPTEGLDPNQRVPIRELIKKIGAQRTVLLSTHVLSEVEQTCDRLLVIRRGRIAAQGTLDQLRTQARSRRQVNVEVKGKDVAAGLREIPSVDEIEDVGAVDGRRRYSLLVSGEGDVRPQVFDMAKRRNWVLWDLHEEGASLADLFHSLTALGEDEDYTTESAEPSEGGRFGWRWPPSLPSIRRQ
jgi:ABC-2 type transport system ATP-binding protein